MNDPATIGHTDRRWRHAVAAGVAIALIVIFGGVWLVVYDVDAVRTSNQTAERSDSRSARIEHNSRIAIAQRQETVDRVDLLIAYLVCAQHATQAVRDQARDAAVGSFRHTDPKAAARATALLARDCQPPDRPGGSP